MIESYLLTECLETFLSEQFLEEKSKNTILIYRNAINKFINFVSDINIIKKQTTLNYKEFLNEISSSVKSKNLWIIILNKYLKYLGYPELCVTYFKTQTKNTRQENLSISDYKRILRYCKRLQLFNAYYFTKLIANTGLRISEVLQIKVEQLKKSEYIVVKNKGKERVVPVPQKVRREILKYCRENKILSGSLFPSSKSKNGVVARSTFNKQLKKVAGAARVKISNVYPHAFRHLFATIYLQNYPDDIAGLADILGHSNLETTRIYTRLNAEQLKRKMEGLQFR